MERVKTVFLRYTEYKDWSNLPHSNYLPETSAEMAGSFHQTCFVDSLGAAYVLILGGQ